MIPFLSIDGGETLFEDDFGKILTNLAVTGHHHNDSVYRELVVLRTTQKLKARVAGFCQLGHSVL
jgi:hypothetical protein